MSQAYIQRTVHPLKGGVPVCTHSVQGVYVHLYAENDIHAFSRMSPSMGKIKPIIAKLLPKKRKGRIERCCIALEIGLITRLVPNIKCGSAAKYALRR